MDLLIRQQASTKPRSQTVSNSSESSTNSGRNNASALLFLGRLASEVRMLSKQHEESHVKGEMARLPGSFRKRGNCHRNSTIFATYYYISNKDLSI